MPGYSEIFSPNLNRLQDTSECAWTSRVPHPAKGTRGDAETATNLPGLQKLSWCHTFLHIGLQEWVGALLAVPRVQTCAEKASNSTSLSGFCGVLGKLGAIAEMVSLQYCQDMLTKNRKAHDLNIEFHGQKMAILPCQKALPGEGFSTLIPKNAAFLASCPFQLINTHQTSGSLRFLGLPKLQRHGSMTKTHLLGFLQDIHPWKKKTSDLWTHFTSLKLRSNRKTCLSHPPPPNQPQPTRSE